MVDALRKIVRSGLPQAIETIKWSAPSFAVDGEDRVTLGLAVRVSLAWFYIVVRSNAH